MKLIDLLVQELPKRGGWPNDALSITQDNDGSLCVWDTNDPHYDGLSWKHHTGNSLIYFWYGEWTMPLASDHKESIVTYWQYKEALAASQKPAWNGEGLPPVGCECEWLASGDHDWVRVTVLVYDGDGACLKPSDGSQSFFVGNVCGFRPLRTEVDKKREVAAQALCDSCGGTGKVDENLGFGIMWFDVFDAIAAGRIPGVKLDD